jgi:hypothetical protein
MILFMPISKSNAVPNEDESNKVIVLILDQINLEEIFNSNAPNIESMLENGGIGLMNTRAKSSTSNKGSAYLSLGMGTRTLASTQGGLAFQKDTKLHSIWNPGIVSEDTTASDFYKLYTGKTLTNGEIINIAIGDIEKTALDITPNNQIGLLGKIARENGLVIGVVGNSDIDGPSREFTMLAMDENGIIPLGYVDRDLLTADGDILGGVKLDEERLLNEVENILPETDILFIDYGDTSRVQGANRLATDIVREQQKVKVIEQADSFLGEIMDRVNLEKTLFMIISPNPSKEMVREGNFALTPIIVSGNNTEKGLLCSNTTHREGLVTNFDFGPTIFNFLETDKIEGFIGEPMDIIQNENSKEILLKNQAQYLYLRNYRSVFHWVFIALVGISLVGFYLPKFTKLKGPSKRFLNHLSFTTMSIPLTMMTVSLFGYKSIILDLLYVFVGAFIISIILNKIFKEKLIGVGILGFITSLFLLLDTYFIKKLMIISPLGSDAIAGGRFYGIGNDYMGILIGSTLLWIFSLFQFSKINKSKMTIFFVLCMSLIIVGLSPFFGANMGGTLSAILITLLSILIILDKKISFKKLAILVVGVIIIILIIAGLDTLFNPSPTHAGKALTSLTTGGWDKFFEIIGIKLKQVFWNLAHASWNIILFLQIILSILLYKTKDKILLKVREDYGNLFKGLIMILLGSIVVFLFNDTGTIAAALMLIYLFMPLGILINDI